jgi:glycine hydroxymethyltransferase
MTIPPIDSRAPSSDLLAQTRAAIARQGALFRGDALVLYAGSNLPHRDALSLYEPALSAMPAMGPPDGKEQPGSATVAALELALSQVARQIFHAAWADARLQSCSIANLATYVTFGKQGLLLSPAPGDGGHFSQIQGGTPGIAGLSAIELPFDAERQRLDAEQTARAITENRPQVVMLGRSVVLGPDDLRPVAEAATSIGARTIYDASHVAGLIAGGVFPNPLEAGIDLMTMSTYKTLGGPPGAIVCGRHEADGEAFAATVNRAFLANQDAARYPVLLASLLPFRDGTGEPHRVIENASAFKRGLEAQGLPVLLPSEPAASHQVVVPTGALAETLALTKALEEGAILVGRCPHPGQPGCYGLRFGVQYATRLGLGPEEISDAAKIVARLIRPEGAVASLSGSLRADRSEVAAAVRALLAPFRAGQDAT